MIDNIIDRLDSIVFYVISTYMYAKLIFFASYVDCGNTSFSGSEGVITSPNFPLPYPHNISCTYSIDVSGNNSVLLKFLNFDLEAPGFLERCRHDWLTVSEG